MTTIPAPSSEDSRLEQAKAILGKVSVQAQPRILIEINRMARSDDVNFDLVADLVAQDVGLSAKLLKLASSPLHSKGQKFNSVHEALMAIGLEDFRVCFTSVSLSDFMGKVGYPYKGFIEHSQRVSVICKEIAELLSPRHANHAYTLGLFHDVGAVLIPLYQRSYIEHIQRALPLYFGITELEYNLVGTNHCAVGELFGQTWGLSPDILSALRYHHRPENDSLTNNTAIRLKMILQIAELLNDKIVNNDDRLAPFSASKELLDVICAHFALSPDDLVTIEKQVLAALSQKVRD